MREHHRRVVERLAETYGNDPRYPAIIIGGSVAKGRAAEDADVDILLVATDEEFARADRTKEFWYFNRDLCDYPGGYIDGKIVNLQFLKDVAEKGSEPARAAFVGAFLAYSRMPELEVLLKKIPVYQEQEQREKIIGFASQVMLLTWYVGEAEKRNDSYLMNHTISDLVLYAGRLILAHNKILYPYHKWFMWELERAEKKPENFMGLIHDLLEHPSKVKAVAFKDTVINFHDWGVSYDQAVVKFMEYSEWNWREGKPPLADW